MEKSIKFKDEFGHIRIVYYRKSVLEPGIFFTVFGTKTYSGIYYKNKIKWEKETPSEKDINACMRCFNLLVFT